MYNLFVQISLVIVSWNATCDCLNNLDASVIDSFSPIFFLMQLGSSSLIMYFMSLLLTLKEMYGSYMEKQTEYVRLAFFVIQLRM